MNVIPPPRQNHRDGGGNEPGLHLTELDAEDESLDDYYSNEEEDRILNQKLNQLPSPFTQSISFNGGNNSAIARSSYNMRPISLDNKAGGGSTGTGHGSGYNYQQTRNSGLSLPHSLSQHTTHQIHQQQQSSQQPAPRLFPSFSSLSERVAVDESSNQFRSRSPSPLPPFSFHHQPSIQQSLPPSSQQLQQHRNNQDREYIIKDNSGSGSNQRRPRSRERSTSNYNVNNHNNNNSNINNNISGGNNGKSNQNNNERSRSRSNSRLKSIFNSIHSIKDDQDSDDYSNTSLPSYFTSNQQNRVNQISNNPFYNNQQSQQQQQPQQQQHQQQSQQQKQLHQMSHKSTTSIIKRGPKKSQSPSIKSFTDSITPPRVSRKHRREILDLLSEHEDYEEEQAQQKLQQQKLIQQKKELLLQQHQQQNNTDDYTLHALTPIKSKQQQQQQYPTHIQQQQQQTSQPQYHHHSNNNNNNNNNNNKSSDIPFYDSDSENSHIDDDYFQLLKQKNQQQQQQQQQQQPKSVNHSNLSSYKRKSDKDNFNEIENFDDFQINVNDILDKRDKKKKKYNPSNMVLPFEVEKKKRPYNKKSTSTTTTTIPTGNNNVENKSKSTSSIMSYAQNRTASSSQPQPQQPLQQQQQIPQLNQIGIVLPSELSSVGPASNNNNINNNQNQTKRKSLKSALPLLMSDDDEFSDQEFEEMLKEKKKKIKKDGDRHHRHHSSSNNSNNSVNKTVNVIVDNIIGSGSTSSSINIKEKEKEEISKKKGDSMSCKYGYIKELDPSFDSKWKNIIKKEMPSKQKVILSNHERGIKNAKNISQLMKVEVKRRFTAAKSARLSIKDVQARSRKLTKEMGMYWRKYEKDERDAKKKAEKDEANARKREEEIQEAKRQQRKLNFLITQTELYSHFMSKKLTPGSEQQQQPQQSLQPQQPQQKTKENGNDVSDSDDSSSEDDLNPEERAEEERLKQEAMEISKRAVQQQLQITQNFDNDFEKLKEQSEVANDSNNNNITTTIVDSKNEMDTSTTTATTNIQDLNSSNIPAGTVELKSLKQPTILNADLKAYQLKGMSWIVNLYDQGINGILADEMGLGKTIQSIAVLAHLAEEKNIWGPFLIVTPKSTLHNWKNEFARFVPSFRVLPYWGNQKQRQIIRKYWNPKKLYSRNSPFHVLITSYNVMVLDEKYFHRIRWQYMVLDEAHAIKSSSSNRWKTLMSFNCRNRLLLTGTPIQNSMAELWALLHFIMPTLFDSHEEFAEWFSKDIENHANSQSGLNEHQLNRLHLILKPFMLRRIKKDVENEMPPKKEIEVACSLTVRQKKLYQGLKSKISVSELLDNTLSDSGMKHLMNLVMQFRKVCNHPELFERSECRSPYLFQEPPEFETIPPPYSDHAPPYLTILHVVNHNPIHYTIPKLIFRNGTPGILNSYGSNLNNHDLITFKLSLFNNYNIHQSLQQRQQHHQDNLYSFSRFTDLSPNDLSNLYSMSTLDIYLDMVAQTQQRYPILDYMYENYPELPSSAVALLLSPTYSSPFSYHRIANSRYFGGDELIQTADQRCFFNMSLIQSVYRLYPKAISAPIESECGDRSFYLQKQDYYNQLNTVSKVLLFGVNNQERKNLWNYNQTKQFKGHHGIDDGEILLGDHENSIIVPSHYDMVNQTLNSLNQNGGIMGGIYKIFGSSPIWIPSFSKSLSDSGKLQVLDKLLKQLKKENHRVLVYCQMTKMINILEDFVIFRKYKYLRLDGSSKLEDRRDLVDDFQTDRSIFVFLLSTRACGIGINLTAADTVIFFDSDWNPTMDEQAMDRCHRLGQTKPVTVYRLVTKGTVEERVIKRAKQKHQIQSIVIAGGKFENEMRTTEVVSFLLDDDEVEEKIKNQIDPVTGRRRLKPLDEPVQDKPFSPNDIPVLKPSAKGRKPNSEKNKAAAAATANASTTTSTASTTTTTATTTTTTPPTGSDKPAKPKKEKKPAKPPAEKKKKGPKPGSKRTKKNETNNTTTTATTTTIAPTTTPTVSSTPTIGNTTTTIVTPSSTTPPVATTSTSTTTTTTTTTVSPTK